MSRMPCTKDTWIANVLAMLESREGVSIMNTVRPINLIWINYSRKVGYTQGEEYTNMGTCFAVAPTEWVRMVLKGV